jgi:hypothetical protein
MTISSTFVFPWLSGPIKPTSDNGAFCAKKEGYMASWEGMERAYKCMCQRTLDNTWPGCLIIWEATWDLVGLSQTSAFITPACVWTGFGCMDHGHNMMTWHKHSDIFDVWICEVVIYHTPGGISSPIYFLRSPLFPF